MQALIVNEVTATVGEGSIVNVSESQFLALGNNAVAYKSEAKEVVKEDTKTASKKTSKAKR